MEQDLELVLSREVSRESRGPEVDSFGFLSGHHIPKNQFWHVIWNLYIFVSPINHMIHTKAWFYLEFLRWLTSKCCPCCRSICILKFAVFFFEQAIKVFLGHRRQMKWIFRAELGNWLLLNLKNRWDRYSYFVVNSSCSAVISLASSGSAMVI